VRLRGFDYSLEGTYFVTMCTEDRECLFGEVTKYRAIRESPLQIELSEMGKMVETILKSLPQRFTNIELDSYVIMPNHIHLLFQIVGAIHESPAPENIQVPRSLLSKIIGYFKMNTSKEIHTTNPNVQIWQRNYYEHIVRDERDLNRIQEYIQNNPINWEQDELFV